MPTYDYVCEACEHRMEAFQSISEKPLRKCPACGKPKLKRLIGAGAGLIFKGSGFYITDYRSGDYKSKAEADAKAAAPPAAEAGSSEGSKKPETEAKPKPAESPSSGATDAKSEKKKPAGKKNATD